MRCDRTDEAKGPNSSRISPDLEALVEVEFAPRSLIPRRDYPGPPLKLAHGHILVQQVSHYIVVYHYLRCTDERRSREAVASSVLYRRTTEPGGGGKQRGRGDGRSEWQGSKNSAVAPRPHRRALRTTRVSKSGRCGWIILRHPAFASNLHVRTLWIRSCSIETADMHGNSGIFWPDGARSP